MRLPNGDRAIIDSRKVVDYCLSPDHEDGKHKAYLFEELLGLTLANAQLLLDALKAAAANHDALAGKQDKYGQRYVLDFEFTGPAGTATIRSAWIIRDGEDVPRLRDLLYTVVNGEAFMPNARQPKLLDLVAVTNTPADADVAIGDVGTVVELLPPDGLEVEFLDRDGRTRCVTTLAVTDVLVLNRERTRVA